MQRLDYGNINVFAESAMLIKKVYCIITTLNYDKWKRLPKHTNWGLIRLKQIKHKDTQSLGPRERREQNQ